MARDIAAHGSAAHEDAEKRLMGTAEATAQAAAVTMAGGGTAGAVTTTGSGYEVIVTKSDGSSVESLLDTSAQRRSALSPTMDQRLLPPSG